MSERSDCWYSSVCNLHTDSCVSNCIRYAEMKFLMDSSGIPDNRQVPQKLSAPKQDYESFCRLNEIKASVQSFVNNGHSLYITSRSTGNGKTSWAIKLMLKYFDTVWAGNGFKARGLFIHVPTFLLRCKDFSNKDYSFEEMKKTLPVVDLVVWDDIASTDISAYDYSQLLMYIDNRVLCGKSNIFTGNIVGKESLQKAVGDKLTSRILSSNTEVIVFNGSDKR